MLKLDVCVRGKWWYMRAHCSIGKGTMHHRVTHLDSWWACANSVHSMGPEENSQTIQNVFIKQMLWQMDAIKILPLSVRPQHSPLSSFIPSSFLLLHACGKVHQHGRVVMIKEAVCLLNYVYAIESEITELTVNDSFEYLGRGQRPSDIHTLLFSIPLPLLSHPPSLPQFLMSITVLL